MSKKLTLRTTDYVDDKLEELRIFFKQQTANKSICLAIINYKMVYDKMVKANLDLRDAQARIKSMDARLATIKLACEEEDQIRF